MIIPSIIGYLATKVNYDILVYLPKDIETIQGEDILTDDFNMGAYAVVVAENMKDKEIIRLEDNIKEIEGVNKVASINDITGTTIPIEFLPTEITDKVAKGDSRLILVTFNNSTSDDITLDAVEQIRGLVNKDSVVGGMSAMVLDTKELFNSEMLLYVVVSVILCIIVLTISLDSYIVPFLLIANIGVAILFNMGSNIFLGDICYITKAIASVLQLGVTTDFSIFLYHKYEKAKKKNKNIKEAMSSAISETLVSVLGSSLTTIAGFLALCTMNLKLGVDIGIVMAKGVVFGLICVVTLFPALLLIFDKQIEKTKHKELLPKFNILKNFVMKHYKLILVIFVLLLFPAFKAQQKTSVYYKLDESIPADYGYTKATKKLKNDYDIVSQEIILVSKDMKESTVNEMVNDIENVDGINLVLSSSSLTKLGLDESMLNDDIKSMLETDKYKIVLVNSVYDIATDELNEQITEVSKIVKSYDEDSIVAGEGPLMKDLVEITDTDFKNVNYTSIGVIFILMLFVLKSISLPILLVSAIEFAIFINMGVPYFTGTEIPFIASVVIGTIQLGATIDYAILMTTKYLEERKNGKDKKEAIRLALDNSVTSIFVSGMCFFAATIGVSVVSDIDMIGSLCTLISRGAIISMIVVMTVVPSLLMVFDKVIIKTTMGFKKGNDNMKKSIKKVVATSLIGLMLFQTLPVYALTKDEVVYSKLDETGKVKYTTVTEHLINDDKLDKIKDISDLKDIENTNGEESFSIDGTNVTWNANGNDIYYKGSSTKTLPVELNMTVKLDGEEVNPNKILGKKGNVEITLKYKNNEKHGDMYTPFVVAMEATFDSTTTKDINIVNGKVVSNGKKYIVAGVAAPGLYESLNIKELQNIDTITITYNTDKFELPSIYSVVTSKVLDSIDLDNLNSLDGLYSKVNLLKNSSTKLVNGSKTLSDGINKVSNGVNELYEGSNLLSRTLTDAINKMENDSAIDNETLQTIKTQTNETINTTFTDEYKNQIGSQAVASTKQSYQSNVSQLEAGINAQVSAYGLDANTYCNSGNVSEGLQNYCAQYISLSKMVSELDNPGSVLYQTIYNTAVQTAIQTASATASSVSEKVAVQVANVAKQKTLNSLKELNENISKINNGLKSVSDGVSSLNSGASELSQGMEQFNVEGINKIADFVNNDLKQATDKVEKLQKLAKDYNTFTNVSKGTNGNIKFILVIDSIKVKEEKKVTKNTKKKESIGDKIINLFK